MKLQRFFVSLSLFFLIRSVEITIYNRNADNYFSSVFRTLPKSKEITYTSTWRQGNVDMMKIISVSEKSNWVKLMYNKCDYKKKCPECFVLSYSNIIFFENIRAFSYKQRFF